MLIGLCKPTKTVNLSSFLKNKFEWRSLKVAPLELIKYAKKNMDENYPRIWPSPKI
ncbi:MAG: hypothetical protein ACJA1B_002679 [Polaribacter sp.]|jgi:hypothetical protein